MRNCKMSGNRAEKGAFLYNRDGTVTLVNCVASGNKALSHGGVIANFGGNVSSINSTLERNTAEFGGAVYTYEGQLVIQAGNFNNNQAGVGGAVYGSGEVSLASVILEENNAKESGGAIAVAKAELVISENCHISKNESDGPGGAVMCSEGTVNINHSNFHENKSKVQGGAIVVHDGQLNSDHCTFDGNSSGTAAELSQTKMETYIYRSQLSAVIRRTILAARFFQ